MKHFYIADKEIKPDATGNEFQRYAFILNNILNRFDQDVVTRTALLQEFINHIQNDNDLNQCYKKSTMPYIYMKNVEYFTDDTAKRFMLGLKIHSKLLSMSEDKPEPQQKNTK